MASEYVFISLGWMEPFIKQGAQKKNVRLRMRKGEARGGGRLSVSAGFTGRCALQSRL